MSTHSWLQKTRRWGMHPLCSLTDILPGKNICNWNCRWVKTPLNYTATVGSQCSYTRNACPVVMEGYTLQTVRSKLVLNKDLVKWKIFLCELEEVQLVTHVQREKRAISMAKQYIKCQKWCDTIDRKIIHPQENVSGSLKMSWAFVATSVWVETERWQIWERKTGKNTVAKNVLYRHKCLKCLMKRVT